MIITLKQQENTIQLDNKLFDGEVDMMDFTSYLLKGFFICFFHTQIVSLTI